MEIVEGQNCEETFLDWPATYYSFTSTEVEKVVDLVIRMDDDVQTHVYRRVVMAARYSPGASDVTIAPVSGGRLNLGFVGENADFFTERYWIDSGTRSILSSEISELVYFVLKKFHQPDVVDRPTR